MTSLSASSSKDGSWRDKEIKLKSSIDIPEHMQRVQPVYSGGGKGDEGGMGEKAGGRQMKCLVYNMLHEVGN